MPDEHHLDLTREYALRLGVVSWKDPHRGPVRMKVGAVLGDRERRQAMENARHWPADVPRLVSGHAVTFQSPSPRPEECPYCHGAGRLLYALSHTWDTCANCGGSGQVTDRSPSPRTTPYQDVSACDQNDEMGRKSTNVGEEK